MPQNVDGRDGSTGARPIGAPPRRPAAAWLVPLLLLLVILVVLALLISRCGGSSSGTAAPSPSATAAAANASAPAAATGSAAAVGGATPTAGGGGTGASGPGTITANGVTVLPLSGSSTASLTKYAGQDAVTSSVRVQSVPADEGFWVGTSTTDRVWVQLTGQSGESPYTVKVGDDVTFTGTFVKNTPGFADKVGVSAAEGKAQLDAQGAHIDAGKSSLKLAS